MIGSDVEGRDTILLLKIYELLHDGSMPILGRSVERRGPILHLEINVGLKINVTANINQMLRDGACP